MFHTSSTNPTPILKGNIMATVYDTITDRIIKQLEAGTAPWHKPWASRGESAIPRNLRTLKKYRGINVWILMSAGFSSPYFLTFKQAQELGGHVRKGEKGLPVVFWKFDEYEKENTATGETEKHEYAMCRYYTVFNVSQCEDLQVVPAAPPDDHPDIPPITICEEIIAGWSGKPTIKHGSSHASYHKVLDYISMPDRNAFDGTEEYYSTLFHEATHATGHPNRLNRKTLTDFERFGDTNYGQEEMCAELGAAYLCGYSGIETKTINNSAAYLASWLKVLKQDSRMVLIAAGQAQRAVDLDLLP
jgi:antirestriction protein ArdC